MVTNEKMIVECVFHILSLVYLCNRISKKSVVWKRHMGPHFGEIELGAYHVRKYIDMHSVKQLSDSGFPL